jgi:TrmH family RNA methyltransferase
LEIIEVKEKDLLGLGEFQTNDKALAVARIKVNEPLSIGPNEFALVLDDIRDPGNLGTMIRTADWFGMTKVIASLETADFYNPKVIHATMGSFTRVKIFYTDLEDYLRRSNAPVFGTYLQGTDIRQTSFGNEGLIVVGNESKGIRPSLEKFVHHKITIPRIGKAESLNAGIAAGILCYAVSQGKS